MSRRGDYIITYTGKQVYPLDPRPEDIEIEDIAHALSHQCRFAGHTRKFYSVADHSIWVASLLPENLALWGLLHDASEAYMSDIPSPLKRLPEMSTYRTFEAGLQYIIYLKFGLYGPEPPEVKAADREMLGYEIGNLMPEPESELWAKWKTKGGLGIEPAAEKCSPGDIKRLFLRNFYKWYKSRETKQYPTPAITPLGLTTPITSCYTQGGEVLST